ncbi:transglycosylase SLT domain-containing protein [Sabulicella glaciei]|uniref:Lytic transglycosylase domain-containing protein n=1 Tax=Sabulicella glaciei TaxID=2984948 RepID=A0ABT3P183_9PROT|nr:transglycosylase SLT domain-containing protein [Roseococcus sp. MDT2-1-1]MCW8088185.1 lytic transglycosylase domain-containing protein [Roseococcus sp. MDT2-1-1]
MQNIHRPTDRLLQPRTLIAICLAVLPLGFAAGYALREWPPSALEAPRPASEHRSAAAGAQNPSPAAPPRASSAARAGSRGGLDEITNATQAAAVQTGIDRTVLLAFAASESSLRASARNSRSSAVGLMQFTEQSWLLAVRRFGHSHGLGELAGRITQRQGRFGMASEEELSRVLDLRGDARLAASLAAETARFNAARFRGRFGSEAAPDALYAMHVLGTQGGLRLLDAVRREPARPASEVIAAPAIAANSRIFRPQGRDLTATEAMGQLRLRYLAGMDMAMRREVVALRD